MCFPNPTPPYISNGLNEVPPGLLAQPYLQNVLIYLNLLQQNLQSYNLGLVEILSLLLQARNYKWIFSSRFDSNGTVTFVVLTDYDLN